MTKNTTRQPAKKTAPSEPTARRGKRSLKEKAQEALDIEQRRRDTLKEREERLEVDLAKVREERIRSDRRVTFLASDPDLHEDEPEGGASE